MNKSTAVQGPPGSPPERAAVCTAFEPPPPEPAGAAELDEADGLGDPLLGTGAAVGLGEGEGDSDWEGEGDACGAGFELGEGAGSGVGGDGLIVYVAHAGVDVTLESVPHTI